jgi:hypothetical protein
MSIVHYHWLSSNHYRSSRPPYVKAQVPVVYIYRTADYPESLAQASQRSSSRPFIWDPVVQATRWLLDKHALVLISHNGPVIVATVRPCGLDLEG